MFDVDDIETLESDDFEPEDHIEAYQRAINGGMWSLQGSYGRAMMAAIENGDCMLGNRSARDAYGNYIPSRDEVQPGTKGSYEFVAEVHGEAYADWVAKV